MATQNRALAVRMVPLVREGVGDVTLITELALFDNHVVYARGLFPHKWGNRKSYQTLCVERVRKPKQYNGDPTYD